jgi:hypothetical protein
MIPATSGSGGPRIQSWRGDDFGFLEPGDHGRGAERGGSHRNLLVPNSDSRNFIEAWSQAGHHSFEPVRILRVLRLE